MGDDANKPYIGGQALIEGVMMRSPRGLSIAVRRPDGSLIVQEDELTSGLKLKLWKLPFFRGVGALKEALTLGYRALMFSAEQQMSEEEKAEAEGSGKGAMLLGTLLAVGLFVALPQVLASGSGKLFGIDFGLSDSSYHAVIGGFKLLIFFAYIAGISMLEDVRRTFQYHGAEHKTIHAYEKELPLTVENVRNQTTLHPRCGTTFIVVVILVSILVGSLVAPLVLPDAEGPLGWGLLLGLRLALLPVIAGLSFELQRFTARYCTKGPLQVLLLPGFLFQKISTREPDDDQIEVAIVAMEAAAWREAHHARAPKGADDLVFGNFDGFRDALPTLRALSPAESA